MERLSLHILSLLRLYDSVVLPGIGVYSLTYRPASFDRADSLFLPPSYEVDFREDSDADASTLIKSYVRKGQFPEEVAEALMLADLEEFREYLSLGGNPVLPIFESFNLGFPPIRMEVYEENMCDPSATAPLLLERRVAVEEVSVVEEESIAEEESVAEKTHEEKNDPEEERIIEVERPEKKAKPDYHEFSSEYYYLPIHKKLAKLVACILLVVIVGIAAIMPVDHTTNCSSTASITPIAVAEDSVEEEQKEETPALQNSMAEIPAQINTSDEMKGDTIPGATSLPSSPFVDTSADDARYFAVVAAFKTEKEAETFVNSHKGDKSRFSIIRNKKFYLISVASAVEKADLESNMPLIRSHYADAWIFTLPS